MDREEAQTVYVALAVALGLLVGLGLLPEPWGLAIAIAGGIVAWYIRARIIHASAWSRTDMLWSAFFVVAFLPAAWLAHRWPFS